ncbi:MAG: hypothetical protein N4A37_09820 [Prolixibacteraceae bacterium]|jgi:hypothetical protein|nr:hypothetical protein [Prolixibacteraceae bacterium]
MIGNVIRAILLDKPEIKEVFQKEIKPIKVQSDQLPAACYRVAFLPPQGKFSQRNKEFNVEIVTFFESYEESWNISMLICEALQEVRKETFAGRKILDIQCEKIEDDYEYNLDTYGQKISLRVVVC